MSDGIRLQLTSDLSLEMDRLSNVSITPAIYKIESLSDVFEVGPRRDGEIKEEIRYSLGRGWISVLDEMRRGRLVTFYTAAIIQTFLHYIGRKVGPIYIADDEELGSSKAAFSEKFIRRQKTES